MSLRRATTLAVALATVAATLTACGSDDGPPLSAEGAAGRDVADNAGCSACHSTDGSTKPGPTWSGLAGSSVELADGSTVVADEAYLRQSIMDPGAQQVAGFTIVMPPNNLNPDQIDAVVSYIEELS
ncbi:MAG: c-type cytochrome [Acidimicrobiales bacterium]